MNMNWFCHLEDLPSPTGKPVWTKPLDQPVDAPHATPVIIGQPAPKSQQPPPKTASEPILEEPEVRAEPDPPAPEPIPDPRVEIQLKLLFTAIGELAAQRKKAWDRDLDFVTELALQVANELVCGQIDAEPSRVRELVKAALEASGMQPDTRIRLHPDILVAVVDKGLEEELSNLPATIVEDDSIDKNGCVVESRNNRVDAQLRTRLARIRTIFAKQSGADS